MHKDRELDPPSVRRAKNSDTEGLRVVFAANKRYLIDAPVTTAHEILTRLVAQAASNDR